MTGGAQPNWRKHMQMGRFGKIRILGFSWPEADLLELLEQLHPHVPTREYGDGAETFEDYILPQHAVTYEDYYASDLLVQVRRALSIYQKQVAELSDARPLEPAITLANQVLNLNTVSYRGMRDTFVYWSERRNRLIQIDAKVRRAIFEKGQRELGYRFHFEDYHFADHQNADLPFANPNPPKKGELPSDMIWSRKYPWRAHSRSLYFHLHHEIFEPNTKLWHALLILWRYDEFNRTLEEMVGVNREKRPSPDYLKWQLLNVAESCFEIGQSYDALQKKTYEHQAISYREEKAARSTASGRKSTDLKARRIESLMCAIERHGDLYPRVSEQRIVDQAFDMVVQENPKLWAQGKGQKEAYLSEYIRSVEPYKSRYYRIFGKSA